MHWQAATGKATPGREKEAAMRNKRRVRRAGVTVLVALSLAGCGALAGNKAGGPGPPVVLRMATMNGEPGYMPQVDPYLVHRVAELSAGNVQIDMVYHVGEDTPGGEQQVVRDVATGKYDLGVVGTRVFDTLGVTSFQALTAPLLIDSYPLERAVIGSGIPAQMMGSLDTLQVTGLGVLPDGLRKPIAVRKPLLGPADWRGLTFAAFRSGESSEAIRALGAAPSDVSGTPLDQGLGSGTVGGFEKNLLIYRLHVDLWKLARYVTANVNLWPQTLAVIGNPARLARLTSQQRAWLTEAVRDAAARSTGLIDGDAPLLAGLCASGTRFADASHADLASLQNAFAPVYAQVEQDPQTRQFIAEISRLKQQTPPGPALAIPVGCTGAAPGLAPGNGSPGAGSKATQVTPLDGVWEVSYTSAELAAAHADPSEVVPENYGSFTLTLHRGQSSFTRPGAGSSPQTSATYVVRGDTVTFYQGQAVWRYRWSVYRQTLTFQKLGGQEPDCSLSVSLGQCEPTGFVVKPWRRVSA
jgi:TRAP-type C4-dicarboxylate transport system substrate-binding protein